MSGQIQTVIFLVLGAAIAGVANVIMNVVMIKALNRVRAPDDQIPLAITSAAQRRSFTGDAPLPYVRVLREFRQQFPRSQLYFWSIFAAVSMLAMLLLVGLSLMLIALR